MSTSMAYEIELPSAIVERIERINREYLQLVKEICELDPCASTTVGIKQNLVDIIQDVRMAALCKLARCGYLIPTLGIQDEGFWTRIAEGKVVETEIMHQFISRN